VAKLERIAHAHANEQRRLAKTIATSGPAIERLEHNISRIERALDLREDISGDAFRATITGVTTDKRVEVGERIKEALVEARRRFGQTIGIGNLAGLDLVIAVESDLEETELHLLFPDAPVGATVIAATEIEDEHPVGLVSRLTNRLGDLEERLRNEVQDLGTARANLEQAKEMIGSPFDQAARLVNLRNRQAEITEALTPKQEAERAVDGAMPSSAEAENRTEVGTSVDPVTTDSSPTAFPSPIGAALATAQANGTDTSSHHDRSVSFSRTDLGR
jgi:hypothetical protein